MFNQRKHATQHILILTLVLLGLFSAGCASQMKEIAPADQAESDSGWVESYDEEVAYVSTQNTAIEVQEQLIIRNADLSIIVDDTDATIEAIRAQVNTLGGWEVNSNIWSYNGVKRGNIQVRVPAEKLDSFLEQVQTLANEVTRESSSGQDVTEEFVDLQAQLRNLQVTRDRVRAFLDDAEDVEDALAVNGELSRLEGQIESITGRINYLQSAARYSSVSIEITPDELAQPITIGGWHPEGTIRDAIDALIHTLQWLANVVIYMVLLILPVLLIIIAPLYLLIRFLRRRKIRNRAKSAD